MTLQTIYISEVGHLPFINPWQHKYKSKMIKSQLLYLFIMSLYLSGGGEQRKVINIYLILNKGRSYDKCFFIHVISNLHTKPLHFTDKETEPQRT